VSTADDFVVRAYTPEDKARLLELLQQVWSHKRNVEAHFNDRWWWQSSEPPLYVVEDRHGKLAGLCAYIPFTLRARAQNLSSAWLVDFYVLPQCQGKGLGRLLTRQVEDRSSITASLSQTAMAYRVFRRMGWSERSGTHLSMHPFAARWMFPRSKERRVQQVSVDDLPAADLDLLWERLRGAYGAIANRSSAHIRDRYGNQRRRRYDLLCCYRERQCVGYMVVRTVESLSGGGQPPQGLIVDFLLDPRDDATFRALLSVAVSVLLDRGARRVYCLTTVRGFERILASRGFFSPLTPLLGRRLKSQTKWLTYSSRVSPNPVDVNEWFLTMGDCDIDAAWYQD
jgi:GNAT superfamily N-acetyltransferase